MGFQGESRRLLLVTVQGVIYPGAWVQSGWERHVSQAPVDGCRRAKSPAQVSKGREGSLVVVQRRNAAVADKRSQIGIRAACHTSGGWNGGGS